jgi:2'-5' RNA ligase
MSEGQLRLFTAIQLPEAWRLELSRIQSVLERSAPGYLKLVRPELMHVTLVFLGDQPRSSLPAIQEACSSASQGVGSLPLRLGAPGAFGSPSSLRVLWVGLASLPPGLAALHLRLTDELKRKEIAFDAKPLVPHITLARTRPRTDGPVSQRIREAVGQLAMSRLDGATIEAFDLISSDLKPGGPEYSTLASFPLDGRERAEQSDPHPMRER